MRRMWKKCKLLSVVKVNSISDKSNTEEQPAKLLQIVRVAGLADPGGPEGPRPLPWRFIHKSCSFQAILREKHPILSKHLGSGPSLWCLNSAAPLTKILDPPLGPACKFPQVPLLFVCCFFFLHLFTPPHTDPLLHFLAFWMFVPFWELFSFGSKIFSPPPQNVTKRPDNAPLLPAGSSSLLGKQGTTQCC